MLSFNHSPVPCSNWKFCLAKALEKAPKTWAWAMVDAGRAAISVSENLKPVGRSCEFPILSHCTRWDFGHSSFLVSSCHWGMLVGKHTRTHQHTSTSHTGRGRRQMRKWERRGSSCSSEELRSARQAAHYWRTKTNERPRRTTWPA